MSQQQEFAGRVAIVTGGLRGIGRAIVDLLAAEGAEVHVFDWADPKPSDKGPFTFHKVDVAKSDSVNAAVAAIGKPVTLLVNNAGVTRDKTMLKLSDQDWQMVIDINLTGAFNLMRAIGGAMGEAGGGGIVNITSINGLRGKFGQSNYTAAKAGLIGLTKTAARELGRKNITVNAVAPGLVLTEMALAMPAEVLQKSKDEGVLGRAAEPIDIAHAVAFLLSPKARMITGQVLKVDCGQYI